METGIMESKQIHQPGRERALLTVRQFSERHPAFSQGSLRYLIFNSASNGIGAALVRIGRRLLIDERQFFNWIESQNPGKEKNNG